MKSDSRELRRFGITAGIAFCLVGCFFLWLGRTQAIYLLILSAVLLFLGLLAPILLKPVHRILTGALMLLSWVLTRVLLSMIFYLVVTPLGLLARLFGKDYLGLKDAQEGDSYWIPRENVRYDKSYYEKRF